ncbi:hypothetical protein ASD26_14480 [Streptomyces sp. Root1319]|nr:hypothetical protein ASD26_14480 [Streptomyces sp. Root1319]
MLMPTRDLPGAVTSTSLTMISRLYCLEQLPQERTSLPKSETWNFVMTSLPAPLNWKTLSEAFRAPPPYTVYTEPVDVPLKDAASSPTSSHQTFCSVQLPEQWMPSAAGDPRTTFLSVAPSFSLKIGSWPSSWPPSPRSPLP